MLFLVLHTAVWLKYFHEIHNDTVSFHENVSVYDAVGIKVPLSLMVVRRRRSTFFKTSLLKKLRCVTDFFTRVTF